MEAYRRELRRDDVRREVREVQDKSRRNRRKKGKVSAKQTKRNRGNTYEIYGGFSEGIGTTTYLHGPMDFAKALKLRFRVGDLDLSERRKEVYQ